MSGVVLNNPALRQAWINTAGQVVYELVEPLNVSIQVKHEGSINLEVPAGYETDLASVPRFFWRIFPPFGRYQRAAIVHDWLYTHSSEISRAFADSIFRELMRHLGVPLWRRVAIYYAVRLGGWVGWNRSRRGGK